MLPSDYRIRLATAHDLAHLPAIEVAAARLLAGHAPESVLSETTPLDEFERARAAGHLWVASHEGRPVGFAHATVIEPRTVHLEEIDVHPEHGRRGVGRRLVLSVCAWALAAGFDGVTLITFREVRFNAPFYASLGFRVLEREELGPALAARVDAEARSGLEPTRRVVMRRWFA